MECPVKPRSRKKFENVRGLFAKDGVKMIFVRLLQRSSSGSVENPGSETGVIETLQIGF